VSLQGCGVRVFMCLKGASMEEPERLEYYWGQYPELS